MKHSTLAYILLLLTSVGAVGQARNASTVFVDSDVAFNRVEGVVVLEAAVGPGTSVALYRGLNADTGNEKAFKIVNVCGDGRFDLGEITGGAYTVALWESGEFRYRFPIIVFTDKRPLHSLLSITGSRNSLSQMEYSETVTTKIPNQRIPQSFQELR